MRRTLRGALLAALLCAPCLGQALTLRYAIIVGNNAAKDDPDKPRPQPLLHAEREARLLRDRLVQRSNFDSSPERTFLLQGATRASLDAAVARLKTQIRADRETLAPADTLFLFYFTGHGQAGRLLLRDGPLSGDGLGRVFQTIGADFSVGIFDACYSGSLNRPGLREKGVRPTRGVNVFGALPEDVLAARGSVWFVSSGSEAPSFEDENLGGVFSHFFIEALERAPSDGPGISLEKIWEYARAKTVEYTATRGSPQEPEQHVSALRSKAPLFFSFPHSRTARLALSPSVEGQVLLIYADGQLFERFVKRRGSWRTLPVFPGAARLVFLKSKDDFIEQPVVFQAGREVVVTGEGDSELKSALSQADRGLWVKGSASQTLSAKVRGPGLSVLVGGRYLGALAPFELLVPRHNAGAALELHAERLVLALSLGWGGRFESVGSWSFELQALRGGVDLCGAFDFSKWRAVLGASFSGARLWQRFDDGAKRTAYFVEPSLLARALFPRNGWLLGFAELRGGAVRAPGLGEETGYTWQPSALIGGGFLWRAR